MGTVAVFVPVLQQLIPLIASAIAAHEATTGKVVSSMSPTETDVAVEAVMGMLATNLSNSQPAIATTVIPPV